MSIQQQKKALRKYLKAVRSNLSQEQRDQYSRAIEKRLLRMSEMAEAKRLFIFISYLNEVDTHHLLDLLLAQGKTLAVPKIPPSKPMMAVRFKGWEDLEKDRMGILTPKENQPCEGPFDVAITPGLGFTEEGYRIGYGGGYYDNWFARNTVGHRIALAFEAQLLDEIPTEENDRRVDAVVTEKRIIRTAASVSDNSPTP